MSRLAMPMLGDKLGALYSSVPNQNPATHFKKQAVDSKHTVHAAVLEVVPPGIGSSCATADAVFVSTVTLKTLQLHEGCWVDITHNCSSRAGSSCSRTVRAQVVCPAAPWDLPADASDTQISSCCSSSSKLCVGVSPLLAHNLGLLHQLRPFCEAGATSSSSDNSVPGSAPVATTAAVWQLQLEVVQDSAGPSQGQQLVAEQVAKSVVICKVGQPLMEPLAGISARSAHSSGAAEAQDKPMEQGNGQAGAAEQQQPGSSSGPKPAGRPDPDPDEDELLERLQAYFTQHTRFVSPGDLIVLLVPTRQRLPRPQQQAPQQQGSSLQHCEVAYFQVQQVTPSGAKPLAINPTATHLVLQGGVTRSLLPVGFKAFAASAAAAAAAANQAEAVQACTTASAPQQPPCSSSFTGLPVLGAHASAALASAVGLPGVPGPLTATWKALGRVVAPLLHPAASGVELSVSALLWGPRGSGRRTAARAAAAALGLNFIELSCHDLKASTDSKTVAVLQAAASEASRFAPTLLLLTHLAALLPGGPALGSTSANAAVLQISEALAALIKLHGSTAARQAVLPWLSQSNAKSPGGAEQLNPNRDTDAGHVAAAANGQPGAAANGQPGASHNQPQQQSEVGNGSPVVAGGDDQQQQQQQQQQGPGFVFVVGVCESLEDLPAEFAQCFSHHIEAHALQREHYADLLTAMLQPLQQHHLHKQQQKQEWQQQDTGGASVAAINASSSSGAHSDGSKEGLSAASIAAAAAQMVGLLPADVAGVVADAAAAAATAAVVPNGNARSGGSSASVLQSQQQQQQQSSQQSQQLPAVAAEHLEVALKRVKARTATEIGAPQVPNVSWGDVGGLEDVKQAILDTIELPLKHRHLFAAGLRRRSGVLLYGPPGSGKTLLAKAVATQCSSNFLSVKGPELINMYVGESERQVREAFARARRARPCVMFFDELDSLAPARGASGDSGGVMDRVVAQLLAEIDGVQGGGEDLFIIGATNRPDLLDPALLRPGRLDTLLYVGIAEEPESKIKVLQALTRKFKLSADVDLASLAHKCPVTLSGADLYALCADAWMVAFKRHISSSEQEHMQDSPAPTQDTAGPQQLQGHQGEAAVLEVCQADFLQALAALTPSLSQEELSRYLAIKQHYDAQQGFGQKPAAAVQQHTSTQPGPQQPSGASGRADRAPGPSQDSGIDLQAGASTGSSQVQTTDPKHDREFSARPDLESLEPAISQDPMPSSSQGPHGAAGQCQHGQQQEKHQPAASNGRIWTDESPLLRPSDVHGSVEQGGQGPTGVTAGTQPSPSAERYQRPGSGLGCRPCPYGAAVTRSSSTSSSRSLGGRSSLEGPTRAVDGQCHSPDHNPSAAAAAAGVPAAAEAARPSTTAGNLGASASAAPASLPTDDVVAAPAHGCSPEASSSNTVAAAAEAPPGPEGAAASSEATKSDSSAINGRHSADLDGLPDPLASNSNGTTDKPSSPLQEEHTTNGAALTPAVGAPSQAGKKGKRGGKKAAKRGGHSGRTSSGGS